MTGALRLIATLLLTTIVGSGIAEAACVTPGGIAGDMTYDFTHNVMVYCNGTNWVNMGTSNAMSIGTLSAGNFCTTDGSVINCATGYTGTGNVVLSNNPTFTGTINAASGSSGAPSYTFSADTGTGMSLLGANVLGFSRGGSTWLNIGGSSTVTLAGPTWANGQLTFGQINQGGKMVFARGSDGATTNWIGTNTATGNGIAVTNISSTGFIDLNASGGSGYVDIQTAGSERLRIDGNGNVGIGTTSPNTKLTVNGDVAYQLGTDWTTTGSQNDVALGSFSAIRFNGTAAATFTGIAGGQAGKILYIHNASAYALTLANANVSSAAANRILTGTGANFVLAAGSSIQMQYDPIALNWRTVGGTGTGSGSGTVTSSSAGQVAYFQTTGTAVIGTSTLNIYNNNVGVGTSSPTNILSLAGTAAQTFWMERALSGAGNSLTVSAGGAQSGTTNSNGGNLVLSSGFTTGTGSSSVVVQTYPAAAGSGSTDNAATTALTVSATGVSGTNAATTIQGNAGSGTNANGGNVTIASGVSTGTGASSVSINVYGAGTSGTASNAPTAGLTVSTALAGGGYASTNFVHLAGQPVTGATNGSAGGSSGQIEFNNGGNFLGDTNLVWDNTNKRIGIGAATPSYDLSFGGAAAREIWMERAASGAWNNFIHQAGGAQVGGTNLNGGNLVLASGISTGTGSSSIQFQTAPVGTSGTTNNTPATVMTITGAGNVGIGTTSPTTALQVNGTIQSTSGGVKFPDGTTQTSAGAYGAFTFYITGQSSTILFYGRGITANGTFTGMLYCDPNTVDHTCGYTGGGEQIDCSSSNGSYWSQGSQAACAYSYAYTTAYSSGAYRVVVLVTDLPVNTITQKN